MNSFNPDQNPHILSSPELPEGGGVSNQSSVPQTEPEIMSPADLTAELVGENLEGEAISEGGEGVDTEVPEDSLAAELDSLVQQEGEASKPKFEVNEDGLSLQGLEIQDIKSQIQQLESGEGEVFDAIQNKTLESRQKTRISLEDKKIKLEERQLQLSQMIAQAYGELKQLNPDTKKTFEEFTEEAKNLPTYRKRVSANEEALQEVESKITAFDAETKALVDTDIQKRLGDLQEKLKEAQTNYTEIGAEANDKPILLEQSQRELEETLSKTEFTKTVDGVDMFDISDENLSRIFELYGYVAGMDRIKKLKTDSGVYSGSEQTERSIQYFAGVAKERELNLLLDSKNNLQQEVEGIEGDSSYQEASHLERDRSVDILNIDLLSRKLAEITCEVRLKDKGFELQEDYQKTLGELASQITDNTKSIDTELNSLKKAISNIRALRDFRVPEERNLRIAQLKQIEDYLQQNKSKSRWDLTKDRDAISRLSPILENIKLRINNRDQYSSEYNTINSEFSINTSSVEELNRIYSQSEYIRSRLGKIELTDNSSIIKALNDLKAYIDNYQMPDDFYVKQSKITELKQKIDNLSRNQQELIEYNPNVIYA
jgi:hypothetical protein